MPTAPSPRANGARALCGHCAPIWRPQRVSPSSIHEAIDPRLTDCQSVISHHQRTTLTYEALDRESNALARGLQKRGVKKGDRVAVSLGNNIEFATVWQLLNHTVCRIDSFPDYICALQARGDPCSIESGFQCASSALRAEPPRSWPSHHWCRNKPPSQRPTIQHPAPDAPCS